MDRQKNKQRESELRMVSLNVRGLRDGVKRQKMFKYLQQFKGILLLQETHTIIQDEDAWRQVWGDKVYFSHGSANSRGVAIIVNQVENIIINSKENDTQGRRIILNITVNNNEFTVMNTYFPTADKKKEQAEFLSEINNIIEKNSAQTIWGGDMNTHLKPVLDKFKNQNATPSKTAQTINNMLEETNMMDVWRVLNPEISRYTWRNNAVTGLKQSRIDYWFVPTSLIYKTKQCNIKTAPFTDHNLIEIGISLNNTATKGRGLWKFNNQLLSDKEYVNRINKIIEDYTKENMNVSNKGVLWDTLKAIIRGYTISYASAKAKESRKYESDLIKELEEIEKLICNNTSDDIKQRYTTAKAELEFIYKHKAMGAQIRAKCDNIEYDEKNSKYFFNKEKSWAETKNLSTLLLDDGTQISDPKIIIKEQQKFYEDLYKEKTDINSQESEEALKYFLNSNKKIPKIDNQEKEILEQDIDLKEISLALNGMKNGKSPGSDGYTTNFYKFFWGKIKITVYNSLMYGIQNKELSIEQRRGIISVIPKKDKDIRRLENWRPLTLLNTDYKILAKTLASRLQDVIESIIQYDQCGGIKGRSTFSNIRSVLDVINYVNDKKKTGYAIFLDYHKAFDSINWKFIYKSLEAMNFGEQYIGYVKTIYENIQSAVINNGNLSQFF